MTDTVIKIENLSKQYQLGEISTGTLTHDLNRWLAKVRGKEDPYSPVGRKNHHTQKVESEYIWALKDINLEIKRGEILGIIGKNGAGKSTLLKIISRITSPTNGCVKLKGRLASLLEVGTGMHPEMTARENIYLNGAILGMKRHEITKKFDDIINFSGCEVYVDTPIKRYSSGMRVRLGFAVAAFLESDILIVDEVLAVGDTEFQKKCIGKMDEISSKSGRTILFVSHNMVSIRNICERVMCIEEGFIDFSGGVENVIQHYMEKSVHASETSLKDRKDRLGKGVIQFADIRLINLKNQLLNKVGAGDPIQIHIDYECREPLENINVGISIKSLDGTNLSLLQAPFCFNSFKSIPPHGKFIFDIPELNLNVGKYSLLLAINADGIRQDRVENAFIMEIEQTDYFNTGKLPPADYNYLIRHSVSVESN